MKIFLADQQKNFPALLTGLMKLPIADTTGVKLVPQVSSVEITGDSMSERNCDILFDYHIFPPMIMSYLTQWSVERRRMRVGDTILQQVYIPPVRSVSQKIVFGVRVDAIIDEPGRRGFSYSTLEGHVESGKSIFTFERSPQGNIFKIETFSAPGNLLAKLTGPFFARPYQAFCTKKALECVKKQII